MSAPSTSSSGKTVSYRVDYSPKSQSCFKCKHMIHRKTLRVAIITRQSKQTKRKNARHDWHHIACFAENMPEELKFRPVQFAFGNYDKLEEEDKADLAILHKDGTVPERLSIASQRAQVPESSSESESGSDDGESSDGDDSGPAQRGRGRGRGRGMSDSRRGQSSDERGRGRGRGGSFTERGRGRGRGRGGSLTDSGRGQSNGERGRGRGRGGSFSDSGRGDSSGERGRGRGGSFSGAARRLAQPERGRGGRGGNGAFRGGDSDRGRGRGRGRGVSKPDRPADRQPDVGALQKEIQRLKAENTRLQAGSKK